MGNLNLSVSVTGAAVDNVQETKVRSPTSTLKALDSTASASVPLSTATTTRSAPYLTGFRLASVLLSLALGTFLVAIDISIIAVAIPKISTDFEALEHIGWYGSAYLLTVTALQPLAGRVYKFCDVKVVYLSSILVFEGH